MSARPTYEQNLHFSIINLRMILKNMQFIHASRRIRIAGFDHIPLLQQTVLTVINLFVPRYPAKRVGFFTFDSKYAKIGVFRRIVAQKRIGQYATKFVRDFDNLERPIRQMQQLQLVQQRQQLVQQQPAPAPPQPPLDEQLPGPSQPPQFAESPQEEDFV